MSKIWVEKDGMKRIIDEKKKIYFCGGFREVKNSEGKTLSKIKFEGYGWKECDAPKKETKAKTDK